VLGSQHHLVILLCSFCRATRVPASSPALGNWITHSVPDCAGDGLELLSLTVLHDRDRKGHEIHLYQPDVWSGACAIRWQYENDFPWPRHVLRSDS